VGTSFAFRSLASCLQSAVSSSVPTSNHHVEPAPRPWRAWLVLLVASLSLSSQAWSQACTGLCLQQTSCPGRGTTSIQGYVYAPNGVDVLPNVLVYIPNGTVQPFPGGVGCEQSGEPVTGDPLVSTTTATNGYFNLTNVPVGTNIPLVIQAGRWRRQVVVPTTTACAATDLPPTLTNLPTSSAQGDIPHIAVVTGNADTTECLLRRIGIADSEFTIATGPGRVNLFLGNGATLPGITAESTLVSSQATLNQYDMVMFGCLGTPVDANATEANQANVINYTNAGGRVVANHYGYVWLYNDAPFDTTADWDVGQAEPPSPLMANINQSFAKGAQLATWLYDIGASTTLGEIPLDDGRHDFNGVVSPSEYWLSWQDGATTVPIQYTFNTPVGASAATQCGRVLYYDYHVESTTVGAGTFPAECATSPMTPQEKLAEFGIFDLTVPVSPDVPPTITLAFANTPTAFIQGDSADNIAINITNTSTTTPTNPSLTATFTVPPGLTAENLFGTNAGTGWICTVGTLTCSRTTGLSASTSDPITLVVSVASNAPTGSGSSVSATIAGGGLSANVSGSDPITIIPPPAYVLTVTAGAGGTLGAGTATNGSYNSGSVQPLVAIPNTGYYFTGWTGAASLGDIANANSPSTTVTMNGTENITANFALIPGYVVSTILDDPSTASASNCPSAPAVGSACSLRDAILAADANNGGAGTITFAPSLSGTIALSTSPLPAVSGQIAIQGPGANLITVSGGSSTAVGSIFTVNPGAIVGISGLTIADGKATEGGGIINGSLINGGGTLTVAGCTLSSNSAQGLGGGIFNGGGTLTVTNSTFSANSNPSPSPGGGGGGIYNEPGATLTVSYSTFSSNTSNDYGGAIDTYGPTTVSNSTFSANQAGYAGGAIADGGSSNTVTVVNSIFSGNSAVVGAGLLTLGAPLNASYNLFYNNLDSQPGGNGLEDDCANCTTPANSVYANPNLAPLGNYGGPTPTMLPLPSSAAICAASSSFVPSGITADQRGFPNSTTYNSTACYDLGAVQTNYALSFTTEPPSAGTSALTAMSPAPAVTVTESANPLIGVSTAPVSVTDTQSALTAASTTTANTSNTSGAATLGNLIFNAIGSDNLTATLALNSNLSTPLNLTTTSSSFSVGQASQTITFTGLPSATTYTSPNATYTLNASATSGLPITYGVTGPGTISGTTLTITGAGTMVVTASQTGNTNYLAATPVSQTIVVSQASQTITFTGLPSATTYTSPNATYTLNASATSGLPITYGVTGPATISGTTLTITGAGTVVVTASQTGNTNYLAATPVSQTIVVSQASQTITFTGLPSATTYTSPNATYTLNASATSGLPITYGVTGPATVSGTTLTITGAGTVVVTASQTGNTNYLAATPVSQTIVVSQASQTITFTGLPSATTYTSPNATYTLNASATSGLPITYGVTGPATVSGTTLTITGAGTVVVTASQPGNTNYLAATPVSQTIVVSQASQTIAFTGLPSATTYTSPNATYTLNASATSGLPITYGVTGPGTISGTTLTITGAGTVVVTASQPGNTNYLAATPVSQTIVVSQASQTITFTGLPSATTYTSPNATYTLNASATSGLPITYGVTGPGTISGTTLTITGAGTVVVTASQPGNTNYKTATPVSQTIVVSQASQTITFTGLPSATTYTSPNATYTLNASATSGLPITYSVTGPGTISGTTLTITGAGTVVVTASQPGNTNYKAATPVSQTIIVNKASQTITFTLSAGVDYGVAPIALPVDASSGLPITYIVTSGPGTITGTAAAPTLTITASGTVKVTASQAGNANYNAAASVTATTVVTAVPIATLSTTSINFGTLYLGEIVTQTVTITNTGDATMTFSGNPLIAIVQGGDSNEFIAVDLCPATLAVGKSCSETITFVAGPFYNPQTATLTIKGNAVGSPQTVMLYALVIDPVPAFNPPTLNFGTVKTGTSSTAQTLVVTNVGATALTISGITFTGADPGDFTETNTCSAALAPKGTCSISVTFKPGAKGVRSATLVVADNARISPQGIVLCGTGD
jgi:hypothetical protein